MVSLQHSLETHRHIDLEGALCDVCDTDIFQHNLGTPHIYPGDLV